MEIREERLTEAVVDVRCDVCGASCMTAPGSIEHGTLQARWGYGSQHDGERYLVDLCETCFFSALASLSRERMVGGAFTDAMPFDRAAFGLAAPDGVAESVVDRACRDNTDLPRQFVEATLEALQAPESQRSTYRFGPEPEADAHAVDRLLSDGEFLDDVGRVERAIRLAAMAGATFGSADKARRWLVQEIRGLDGRSPLAASATEAGARAAEDVLNRIAHGLVS